MTIEAMKQALEDICAAKLCEFNSMSNRQEMIRLMDSAITALSQAIEQAQKQEPVLWSGVDFDIKTSPPPRQWVGLSTDEFKFIASKYLLSREAGLEYFQEEIEAKLKEKNT